jgi:hypothetical protein
MNRDVNAVRRPRRTESRRATPLCRFTLAERDTLLLDTHDAACVRGTRLDECAKFRATISRGHSRLQVSSDQSRDRIIPVSVYHLADV